MLNSVKQTDRLPIKSKLQPIVPLSFSVYYAIRLIKIYFWNKKWQKFYLTETEEFTAGEELLTKSIEISEAISDERYVKKILGTFFSFWSNFL